MYAAEALLLAFALKLRVSAALAGHVAGRATAPAAAAALGLDDGSFHRAASFLGQCMPTYVQQPGVGRAPLKGAAGQAMQRLAADGLGWVPTCCNVVTLLCFGLCLVLNWQVGGAAVPCPTCCNSAAVLLPCLLPCPPAPRPLVHANPAPLPTPSSLPRQVTGGAPAAILLLAPLLLLLSQDPLLLRSLEERRRYAPPVAAVAAYLAAAGAWQLFSEVAEGTWTRSLLGFAATQSALLVLTLPCQLLLVAWLWTKAQVGRAAGGKRCSWVCLLSSRVLVRPRAARPALTTPLTRLFPSPTALALQPRVAVLLALAPFSLLALWAGELDEVQIAAGASLAAVAAQLLGAQQAQRAGRALI